MRRVSATLIGLLILSALAVEVPISTVIGCPLYHTVIAVDYVNSVPNAASVGTTVVTTFQVVYPDGTPVTLDPLTASFVWVNGSDVKLTRTVTVVYNGTPGFYIYTDTVTNAFPTGLTDIAVGSCTCSDTAHNFGPTASVDSKATGNAINGNSTVFIGPGAQPVLVQQPQFPYAIIVGVIALILVVFAFILAIHRRKKEAAPYSSERASS